MGCRWANRSFGVTRATCAVGQGVWYNTTNQMKGCPDTNRW